MSSHQVMESQVRSRVIPEYEITILLWPAHKDFGHFYGSSYVATPDGSRTPVSVLSCTLYDPLTIFTISCIRVCQESKMVY